MHSLQGEASENERVPSGMDGSTVVFQREVVRFDWWKWTVRLGVTAYFVGVFYELWQEQEFRLHCLNVTRIMLQQSARQLGEWGLKVEKHYGDYVSTLH